MNHFTKILLFVFFLGFGAWDLELCFAQTDTLVSADTTISPLPTDTTAIAFPDTSVIPSDTAPAAPFDTATTTNLTDTTAAAPDTTPKPIPPKKMIAQFDTLVLLIKPGDIISKPLWVINGTEKAEIFTLNLTYPGGWKALTNTEREYSIEPGDTLFIPVRIVPMGRIQGNTKYLIYAYVINEKKVPVASAHFMAEKHKIVRWDMNIIPDDKIYLMNDENTADFSVNIFNTGNEQQELILDMTNFRKDRLALMDTSDKILKKPIYTFELDQAEDTTFFFRAKYVEFVRNFRLIDVENYRPGDKGEAKKYSVFAQSRESALSGKGNFFKGKKIDLIRLPDETKMNPYSRASIPLTMDINVANILADQPIMNVNFRGRTQLNNGAFLNYYSTTYFSSPFLSSQFLRSGFFNIGYFTNKYSIQVGNVGGMGGSGRGIMGNYIINRNNTVGAFITRGPRLFAPNNIATTSFGAFHNFSMQKFRIQTNLAHTISKSFDFDFLRLFVNYNIFQKHTFGFGVMGTRIVVKQPPPSVTKFGYTLNGNYSGTFFNNRLRSGISATYSSPNSGSFGQSTSWGLRHNSNIRATQNLNIQLINYFQHVDQTLNQAERNLYGNTLTLIQKKSKLKMTPALFYNVTNIGTIRFHSRGLGINYTTFDYETNRMVGVNFRAGYNKLYSQPGLRDFFFLQSFLVFRYRVWSGNIRYSYGSFSASDITFLNGSYPQSIGASFNYQHQFKSPHFVLNSNFTYNHINRLRKHSFGYTPQLYYFTTNAWRFYIQPGYYVSVSKSVTNSNRFGRSSQELTEPRPTISQNLIINAGVRKEFGIPLFWVKTKYPTMIFRAFIDHNGNSKQDPGETSLENVVVKLGEWELLTNERGLVTFKNVFGDSTYALSAFSLADLKGYFPNIPSFITAQKDSSYAIPFVKGVKVHGNVYLDREKLTPGVEKPLDLSGIKIAANNGKALYTLTDGKGDFSFYVPFGHYTISMDEKVLGDRFTLLQNNIELDLDQKTESIFLTFYVVEKRRKVVVKKFDGNGKIIKDSTKTIQPQPLSPEEMKRLDDLKKGKSPTQPEGKTGSSKEKDSVKEKESPVEKIKKQGPIDKAKLKFRVQVGVYGTPDASTKGIIDELEKMPEIMKSKTDEGLTRYTSDTFDTFDSAKQYKQQLIEKGAPGDTTFILVIGDYKGYILTAEEVIELLKD